MKFLDWIFPAQRDSEVLALAQQIAGSQQSVIWQELAVRQSSLGSKPEACGYIRCRALSILRRELRQVATATFADAQRQQVLDHAVSLIVHQFAGAMVSHALAPAPARRAA